MLVWMAIKTGATNNCAVASSRALGCRVDIGFQFLTVCVYMMLIIPVERCQQPRISFVQTTESVVRANRWDHRQGLKVSTNPHRGSNSRMQEHCF